MKSQVIQIFEHNKLLIDEKSFTRDQWKSMGHYNARHGNRYFDLLPNGVKFKQYVGVIQIGKLTIEILPKIDKSDLNESQWQSVLLDMLKECHWMHVHTNQKASLRLKSNSILDAYLEIFIWHCEQLLHEGLVKKYRQQKKNTYALKGRLKFAEHINRNLIHRERFFTEHTIYDRDNIFNRILLKTLQLIPSLSNSLRLKDRLSRLLLDFPELNDINVSASTFEKLKFDRKTERYREAIEIAAMLLLNFRPDIKGGKNHILAILFDMNELWEEYVFRRLRKTLPYGWKIKSQARKCFWRSEQLNAQKIIKPDIVIFKNDGEKIIIDTKWKIPYGNIPSDADLKQVFVYNEYWESKLGFLLYPKTGEGKEVFWLEGDYQRGQSKCVVTKVNILDDRYNINKRFCEPLFNRINEHIGFSLKSD